MGLVILAQIQAGHPCVWNSLLSFHSVILSARLMPNFIGLSIKKWPKTNYFISLSLELIIASVCGVIIGWDKGLLPIQCQAIIETNAD